MPVEEVSAPNKTPNIVSSDRFTGRLPEDVSYVIDSQLTDAPPRSGLNFWLPWGGCMSCRVCLSENQQNFTGELTVAFPGVQRLNQSPVYVCLKTLVCLDCGYAELVLPTARLEQLRKGLGASLPREQIGAEYSRLQ